MKDWKFINPPDNLSLKEKIAYTTGYFLAISQIHNNLSVDSNDKEFNNLNIEIRKFMRNLKKQE
jgi:hypothetical protein